MAGPLSVVGRATIIPSAIFFVRLFAYEGFSYYFAFFGGFYVLCPKTTTVLAGGPFYGLRQNKHCIMLGAFRHPSFTLSFISLLLLWLIQFDLMCSLQRLSHACMY